MAKLKLAVNPTFKHKVAIPCAGGETSEVEFVFKHRTKVELEEYLQSRSGKSDVDSIMEMAVGWDLAEPFDAENVEWVLQNYMGTSMAVFNAYIGQLTQARAKN